MAWTQSLNQSGVRRANQVKCRTGLANQVIRWVNLANQVTCWPGLAEKAQLISGSMLGKPNRSYIYYYYYYAEQANQTKKKCAEQAQLPISLYTGYEVQPPSKSGLMPKGLANQDNAEMVLQKSDQHLDTEVIITSNNPASFSTVLN